MTQGTIAAAMLAALGATAAGQPAAGQESQRGPTPGAQTAAALAPGEATPTSAGLSDLAALTFACPQAGLNAAARAAAMVPTQGSYQFAYFRLVNDAHHAAYEVHFKSNFYGEPELRYCVTMYCQQGWDPKAAQPTVTLMTKAPARGRAGHEAMCGAPPARGRRDGRQRGGG